MGKRCLTIGKLNIAWGKTAFHIHPSLLNIISSLVIQLPKIIVNISKMLVTPDTLALSI